MADFAIRVATLDDAALLAGIELAADQRYLDSPYRDHVTPEANPEAISVEVAQRYCAEGRILVAEVDGRVVAYLGWHLEPDPTYLGVSQVSVLPEFGRQGIGAALMRGAVVAAIAKRASHIVLCTFTDVAWNAPWYHRLGYRTLEPSEWTGWMNDVVVAQQGSVPWENRVWMQLDLETLQGGVANAGAVIRVGEEVRRPANPNSTAIHRLLAHVGEAGFDGTPRPVAVDRDGYERLRFIDGDVPLPPYPHWAQADEALAGTARLIRGFHDASIGFAAGGVGWNRELSDRSADGTNGEVVMCHNDVCMENVVYRHGAAVALLDFDFAAPGRRTHDLAAFARMCIPIDDDAEASQLGWHPADRPHRLAVIADAYGLDAAQRGELLACLDTTITGGGQFVLRHVEAGEQAFIEMWEATGGMGRYDARRAHWAANRTRYAAALGL